MMNLMTVGNSKKSARRISLGRLFKDMDVKMPSDCLDIEISGLGNDSRDIQTGDLFIAVPGHNTDGRRYVSEAVSLGAAAVMTLPGNDLHVGIPVIYSDDIRGDMAEVADRYYDHPSRKLTVAGITGTNGKTTTVYLLAGIYHTAGKKWGKIGTIGYEFGGRLISSGNTTPGVVNIEKYLARMVEEEYHGCAMEVSSHALEQGRSKGVAFSSATFTNLSQDHLDYHKDMESYFEAKAGLFENVPVSVINSADPYGRKLLDRVSGNVVTFSSEGDADLSYSCREMTIRGSILEFRYRDGSLEFDFPLPGLFNHQNAAAAAATALGLGLSLEEVVEGLKKASAVPGRLQPIDLGQPFAVFVDYAHTPDALEKLLGSLRRFNPRNLHIVFGCGGDRDRKKRPLMARVASTLADFAYLTSDNPRTEDPKIIIDDALKGVTDRKRCLVIEDRALAIKTAVSKLGGDDILVIAGKGHEEYQVVGNVRKYFSDIEIVESELRKSGYGNDDRKK
jgi:UDP-N-acetylmuramoyl-L-alanyl-D-glutamate--2,6-diaminopimelate ligase